MLPCLLLADKFEFPIDRIDQTLRYIGIDTSDVNFLTDRVDLDSFRLAIVNELTLKPLEIPEFLKYQSDALLDRSWQLDRLWKILATKLCWSPPHLLEQLGDVMTRIEHPSPPVRHSVFPLASRRYGTCAKLDIKIANVKDSQSAIETKFGVAWSSLPPNEQAFLVDSFPLFLLEEEEAMGMSIEESDSLQRFEGYLAGRFKEIGPGINFGSALQASMDAIFSYEVLASMLRNRAAELDTIDDSGIDSVFGTIESGIGRIAVGSRGNDRYEGKYAVIIDLGGDDEYLLEYDPEHPNQIIIDLDGNDRYYAQTDHCLGAGFMGCGILDDWAGDDIYFAKHFSLGCGLFGTGILIDRGGDDTYQGDICTQGASSFGIGMLLDYEGNDTYSAHLFSQAFAFIMGASALVDHAGNDIYTAGWKYGDVLRYEDHYLSLSQGFGYGLRPHFSGGVAFLVDGGGNDQYSADIFAQGASYWWAFGGLIDYSGTDRYIAHQYAQGAATHLCLAALVDIEGDDLYSSKGVSQGCGHDLAFGLLLDCDGNDQYNAFDLSQAAGSANGVGMLVDLAGNDGHMARVKRNTHGYGNPRRDCGSIGLFLDLAGTDDYRGYGANNSYWVTDSKWGIGADLEPKGEDED